MNNNCVIYGSLVRNEKPMKVRYSKSITFNTRQMYIRIARELFYDDECISKLKDAKNEIEIARIMKSNRLKK